MGQIRFEGELCNTVHRNLCVCDYVCCAVINYLLSYMHMTYLHVLRMPIYCMAENFGGGIHFGGLAALRTILQYFIRQTLHSVMSSLLQNHILCTRPAAKHASLIVGMEFSIEGAYEDIASPKSFVHRRRRVDLSVNTRNTIQTTCTGLL